MRYINTLHEGETIRNVYLCKGKRSAETRNGRPYDNLILQDKTGTLDGKVWDPNSGGIADYDELDFIEVYGESTVTTGDLTGNGKADVLLKRATRGTDSGTVNISILHLENTGWVEYPYNFIHNPDIDLEQPDTFDDEVYLGVTLFEKDGKVMVRFISFQDNDKSQNTVKCTEASYCEDGWYIEDIKMISDFFSGDKYERLLAPLYETENVNEEEMIEQNSEKADDKIEEFSMDEIEELFFGEWEVTKLLGFTKIQNDYTNYPEGHDIIGNHIVINEDVFSSEGLEKYERYQCEVLEPSYEVSPIIDRNWIYNISEAVKEDPELYDWILNYDRAFHSIFPKNAE